MTKSAATQSDLSKPRRFREILRDRQILSWALYDWGNSAFATTVMAGFFPVFFKQYWSNTGPAGENTVTAV